MENLMPFPHSSNQTILITPTNHVEKTIQNKGAMENFQKLIFKLAETHPNNPLNPATKALLQCGLDRFVSEYKRPDHPPYSSMIETTLVELNEKWGSSVESISQHLEKKNDNLPFAHSVFLKKHLEKLGETGEIVATRDKRYGLPGRLKLTKKRGRKMHWKRKLKLIRSSQNHEEDEVKHDEKEQQVTENGNKSNQKVKHDEKEQQVTENGNKSNQTKLETVSAEKINEFESSTRALRWQNRLHRGLPGPNLTTLNSGHRMETCQDQQKAFDSSPIVMNLEESKPKCRRLRVVLKPKPNKTAEEGVKKVLLQCNSEQKPAKRKPGRPPKRAVAT